MQRIFNSLLANAMFFPEKPAFLTAERFLTYGLVARGVASMQQALGRLRLDPEKPVGLLVDDPPRHIIVSLALMGMGYTVAALRDELIEPAAAWGIDNFLVDDRTLKLPSDARAHRIDGSWFSAAGAGAPAAFEWPEDRAVRIVFTSGSTGRPKPIAWSMPMLVRFIADSINYRIGPGDRSMCTVGMSAPGFYLSLAHLMCGKAICFARLPEVLQVAMLYNATGLNCTHAHIRTLLEAKKQSGAPTRFDFIALGCGQLNGAQQSEILTAFGGQISSSYAGTEFGYAAMATGQVLNLRDSLGNCFAPITRIEIVDEEERVLPVGVEGRIRVRQDHLGWSYSGALVREAGDRTAFCYPGDLGFIDASGLMVLTGRADEIINDAGVRFDPEAMEVHLRRIPGLTGVAAIRMPVSGGPPEPWVAMVAQKPITVAQINEWIGANLSGELGSVRFARAVMVDAIPHTGTGKVARQALRSKLQSVV